MTAPTQPPVLQPSFVTLHTTVTHAPLVPEIALYLATDVMNLWHNTETARETKQPPPYWGFAWPGGQALARYVLDHPEIVAGKPVLDFGAGCGLVGIAAAKSGAARVDAAEIDAYARNSLTRNAMLNGVDIALFGDDIIGRDGDWQIILVGDMCYERPLAEALVAWLRRLAGNGVLVLLGDPGRAYLPGSGTTALATYSVPTVLDLEDRTMRETGVYALLANPPPAVHP